MNGPTVLLFLVPAALAYAVLFLAAEPVAPAAPGAGVATVGDVG